MNSKDTSTLKFNKQVEAIYCATATISSQNNRTMQGFRRIYRRGKVASLSMPSVKKIVGVYLGRILHIIFLNLLVILGFGLLNESHANANALPGLTPSFGNAVQTSDGFKVPIRNYDKSYTWESPTVTAGSVALLESNFTWNSVENSQQSWRAIASSSDGTKLVAVVYGGFIYTSMDSGANWTKQTNAGARQWSSVSSNSDGTKLAATVNIGRIYISTDSGVTWTVESTAGTRAWHSIASSSDGTKLAAAAYGGYIYTSSNSGLSWTAQANSYTQDWYSITMSADGTKLAATVYNGFIYTSLDSGVNWTRQATAGSRFWVSLAGSRDGVNLAAGVIGGSIYTSSDSGATWIERSNAGSRDWYSISSSEDGVNLAAGDISGYLYISDDSGANWSQISAVNRWISIAMNSDGSNFVAVGDPGSVLRFQSEYLLVSGLSPGESTTVTQQISRPGYESGTFSVSGSAKTGLALNPVFGLPISTANGFSVTINNFDAAYNWNGLSASNGSVEITTTNGSTRLLTVTGLSANSSSTITATTSRIGYSNGSSSVTGFSLKAAIAPEFGAVSSRNDGFKVSIINFNPSFTWPTPSTSSGVVTASDSSLVWKSKEQVRNWQSIASSSDGTKLVAAESSKYAYDGYLYTSTDSGITWTARLNAGKRSWVSVASNSDGTKLVAATYYGYIYTSVDSGVNWTARTFSGLQNWVSVVSSSDGTKLAAAINKGAIYVSVNSGSTWIQRTNGNHNWYLVSISGDGGTLSAGAYGDSINGTYNFSSTDWGATWSVSYTRTLNLVATSKDGKALAYIEPYGKFIYTSTDSGATWTKEVEGGSRDWKFLAFSSDGDKLVAVAYGGQIYISHFQQELTVSGLIPGTSSTILQVNTKSGFVDGSASITGAAANGLALIPAFDTPTATSDGFTLQIANYNSLYSWAGSNSALGTVSINETGLITVTGLDHGVSSNVTITTARNGYAGGSAISSNETSTIGLALIPAFDTPTATSDGFTVNVTNYNSSYLFTAQVSGGFVSLGAASSTLLPIRVTGLNPLQASTLTVFVSRSGYAIGTGFIAETATAAASEPTPAPAPAGGGGGGGGGGGVGTTWFNLFVSNPDETMQAYAGEACAFFIHKLADGDKQFGPICASKSGALDFEANDGDFLIRVYDKAFQKDIKEYKAKITFGTFEVVGAGYRGGSVARRVITVLKASERAPEVIATPSPSPTPSATPSPTPSATPASTPSNSPSPTPKPVLNMKNNGAVIITKKTASTKSISLALSNSKLIIKRNASIAIGVPKSASPTAVRVNLTTPSGDVLTVASVASLKGKIYSAPVLGFKKAGTYILTFTIGKTVKVLSVKVS